MQEYNSKNIHLARNLRKSLTPHERILWYHLRGRRFQNYKFRRQYPIGKYIADFCCFRNKIIVELDGGHHSDPDKAAHDARRDGYLKECEYVVLRYSNYDVNTNLEGVLESIYAELQGCPLTPNPSPEERGMKPNTKTKNPLNLKSRNGT